MAWPLLNFDTGGEHAESVTGEEDDGSRMPRHLGLVPVVDVIDGVGDLVGDISNIFRRCRSTFMYATNPSVLCLLCVVKIGGTVLIDVHILK